MCSTYQASLLNDPVLGKIAIGAPADFLLIDRASLTLKENHNIERKNAAIKYYTS